MKIFALILSALSAAALLGGCSGEAGASAEEEKTFKNPGKATPPTAEQLQNKGPSFVGEPQSTPVGPGGGPPSSAPPPGATKPPGAPPTGG